MAGIEKFKTVIKEGYTFTKGSIVLGTAIFDGQPIKDALVKIPLKTLNRHGLIAGATGSGKTKTLQVIAEQFSANGIPCLMMDLKGDLSGLAKAGASNEAIAKRHDSIGIPYQPLAMPVELMTISNEKGLKLRATVIEFGPVLFSKILDLNDTQQGVVALLFKYCDDNKLPLLDLEDFKKTLQYIMNEGKEEITKIYGSVSPATVNIILRKIIELEQQGAANFFGEKSFDVNDLLQKDSNGKGVLSIIRLTDIQDKPKMFSTFMLSLLAEVYSSFPEEGDMDKPKLAIFIDEAHLIFSQASKALLDQLEAIIKLIRSKGVGIFFCTQNPMDIPDAVLAQLGLKVQHALRAFTAKDRTQIKKTAENYPESEFYKTDEIITSLGIGEAMISALSEKGTPTPLVAVLLQAPASRMNILNAQEIDELVSKSSLARIYNEEINRESAFEILTKKIEEASSEEHKIEIEAQNEKAKKVVDKKEKEEPGMFEQISKNTMVRQVGRSVATSLARGLLGMLGISGSKRRG